MLRHYQLDLSVFPGDYLADDRAVRVGETYEQPGPMGPQQVLDVAVETLGTIIRKEYEPGDALPDAVPSPGRGDS